MASMTLIRDLLKKQKISPLLKSSYKNDVLEEIASKISFDLDDIKKDEILLGLQEREAKASTGVDNGIAIPHTILRNLNETKLFLFLAKNGVVFHSLDNAPSQIFFVILSPNSDQSPNKVTNLKIMAEICRGMRIEEIRNKLLTSSNLEEALACLES